MNKRISILAAGVFAVVALWGSSASAVTYTMAEVATHNTSANCWAVVNNKVYNLTGYIASHPGGQSAITALCGTNASAAFNAIHGSSSAANAALAGLYIGDLSVPDATDPSIPTNLTATVISSSRIDLSWTASTDNVGVTGYNIYRGGNLIGTSATNSFSNTGLSPSTLYNYRVSAFDLAGNESGLSNQASATTMAQTGGDTTPPNAPANLMAMANSSSQINLSWNFSSDNVGVTGYNIYRNGQLVGTTANNTFNDTGLSPSTTYNYRVRAFDAANNQSTESNQASATTLAVTTPPPSQPGNQHDDDDEDEHSDMSKRHHDDDDHEKDNTRHYSRRYNWWNNQWSGWNNYQGKTNHRFSHDDD